MDDLFDAKLSCTASGVTHDYELQILDITDVNTAAIVQHQFINTDGGQIEHMGNRPRNITFRAYFFGVRNQIGATIPADYNNHIKLLADLGDSRLTVNWKLTHPKYGILSGGINSWTVIHDDTQDYVTIDIGFIVDGTTNVNTELKNKFAQNEATQINASVNANINGLNKNLRTLGYSSLLNKAINFSQNLNNQLTYVTDAVSKFTNEVDTVLDTFDTFMENVTAPISAIERTANFASDIPSRIILSMQGACNRLIQSTTAVTDSPYLFVNNLVTNMINLKNSLPGGSNSNFWQLTWCSQSSVNLIDQTFTKIKEDVNKKDQNITTQSFGMDGVLINTKPLIPILTTDEFDKMLIATRTYVNSTLLLDRENNSLKKLIADLTQYVNQVRIDRPSIKTISVSEMPIHVLMVKLSKPYNYAEEVLSLNPWIKNPNYITGDVQYVG